MPAVQYTPPTANQRPYQPRGAALELFYCRDPYVLIEGPAGTGKSRGVLEKGFALMDLYPGCRIGLFRKTRRSLTQTSMVTFEQKVCPPGLIHFSTVDQEYRHPNGAIMAVGGLDKPSKIMSSEYDVILVPEATEVTEDDAESLSTRLRNGVIPYQQIIFDCNPAGPLHWLNQRCKDKGGDITRLRSRHKDNPVLWDALNGKWTALGYQYLQKLKKLSGVRFYRFFKGIWRQSEGMVFSEWDERIHLVENQPIPDAWPRYWGVDFGYTNPFCWQEWAKDPDDRLWLINEIYHTQKLVSDHAKDILRVTGNMRIRPRALVCDHDAEGRATLERELKIQTTLAYKNSITENIEAVRRRMRPAGDGLPRVLIMRDVLYQRDPELTDAKKPTCTLEEFESYIWDDKKKKDTPKDENDHAMNTLEYVVGHVDKLGEQGGGGVAQVNAQTGAPI